MNVQLIAHTQLSDSFFDSFDELDNVGNYDHNLINSLDTTDGQAVALTAIRTCYSPNKPSEIVAKEGEKYFGSKASDGGAGTDADRLFRMIVRSGHTSTLEHLTFTFAIEGVSRALLAQLTRHRVGFSFSVQSQRYVRMGSDDKIGGFDYVVPE
ncbi:FAD-dependent thymidylate synthase, partial [Bacillus licheniformis]